MKVTEQSSNYSNLDKMSTRELLENMNQEDKTVPYAVEKCIPQIEKLVDSLKDSTYAKSFIEKKYPKDVDGKINFDAEPEEVLNRGDMIMC